MTIDDLYEIQAVLNSLLPEDEWKITFIERDNYAAVKFLHESRKLKIIAWSEYIQVLTIDRNEGVNITKVGSLDKSIRIKNCLNDLPKRLAKVQGMLPNFE
jgi:hypothetical protein